MDALGWLAYLCLAFFVGACGQLVRVAVGLKKLHDKNASAGTKTPFDAKKFWISIVLGALAALLTAILQWSDQMQSIDREYIFTLMAAGYAGSDIIEGLMDRWSKST
ncbi:hypothetical protein E9531_13565 [Lampropedia puyangensis]|uniref:Holin n=1 Tax=Lampropedia puyangensis TaxID=1330072 RepID=A0A4S8EUZ9_9BURK|nr:hypothetical protein [Lampropedia puyangensis]THT98709.1 hypothetical protein E9531_13565 [Lampropedia puyangensis]